MIYKLDNKKEVVSIEDIKEEHLYIGMMSLDELKESYTKLHISKRSLKRCEDSSMINSNIIIPHYMYYYGYMSLINARDIFIKKDSIAFYIFKNLFLVVVIDDDDNHVEEVFKQTSDYVIESNVSITRLVYYFLSELMSKDYLYIEKLQKEIEELEKTSSKSLSYKIRVLNKELIVLRNYYDSLMIIGEDLQMNYHNLFKRDDMRYFEVFTRKIERFSKSIEMLRELLNQVYDFYLSGLNYELNKTIQFFTVITTIFLPLSLITGWYGMNFIYMPEIYFRYSYLILIIVSLILVVGLVLWFKKKKFI